MIEKSKKRPTVGDVCTEILMNDRTTWRIIEIVSPKRVRVEWIAVPNEVHTLSERKAGKWAIVGRDTRGSYWVMEDRGDYSCPEF